MMRDAILNFSKQFDFNPQVFNIKKLKKKKKFLVCGMGGSQLAIDIIKSLDESLDIVSHRDYGLPALSDLHDRLVILSSYSGNTEEVLDALNLALKKGLSVATIAVGGELLKISQKKNLPFIQIPDTGIQPRSALGFSLIGLLRLMGLEKELKSARKIKKLNPIDFEKQGKEIAEKVRGFIPIIYASRTNFAVAYNWKIKLNETGKIPAFCNVFPELNHNEMNGSDVKESIKNLFEKFYYIFLDDAKDNKRVQKRFAITKKLYADRGLPVLSLSFFGTSKIERIFNSLILADWVSLYTSTGYGLESEQVPMVEEFKALMKK